MLTVTEDMTEVNGGDLHDLRIGLDTVRVGARGAESGHCYLGFEIALCRLRYWVESN